MCYGLIDTGEQYNEKYGKTSRKCVLLFELPGETFKTAEGEEKNRTISQTYTLSLNQKSALYKDLIAWRGRPFTDDELKGFDLKISSVFPVCCLSSTTRKTETLMPISAAL